MSFFESETFETILARLLARLPADIDKTEGSVVYDLLAPAAIELAQAYMNLDTIAEIGFADATYGEYLDRRADEQGLTRKAAVQAEGFVTLSGPADTLVPEGTRLQTEADVYFLTRADASLTDGTATVSAIAEDGGAKGNAKAGAINALAPGDLYGVVRVTNAEPFSGGQDEETDAELYRRYKEHVSHPATSGNKYDYEQWAKEIQGISDARCYPTWNGPGTAKVVVVNTNKRAPSSTVLATVDAHLQAKRPVNANITVVGVNEVAVNVSAVVTLASGANINETVAQFSEKLAEYFKALAFKETIVRYSQVGNALLDVEGVIDYENLRVNGVSANIQLQADEVPIVGAINLGGNDI